MIKNNINKQQTQQRKAMKTFNNYRAAALAVLVLRSTSERGVVQANSERGLDAYGNVRVMLYEINYIYI